MHHASLIIGSKEEALAHVESLFGILKGSPDYFPWEGETFGIGEARRLAEQAARKAFGVRKIFFVSARALTIEAQNALLKTFEEPGEGTYFFLVLRDASVVIPTLRSRMQAVRIEAHEANQASEARDFLSMPLRKRLSFAKEFSDEEKNLSTFLDSLLYLTRDRRVYAMRLLSDQRAASSRLVLEHLATVL